MYEGEIAPSSAFLSLVLFLSPLLVYCLFVFVAELAVICYLSSEILGLEHSGSKMRETTVVHR